MVKPVSEYIPTLGSEEKYKEHLLLNKEQLDFSLEKCPSEVSSQGWVITYDDNYATVVGMVLQQMHINKGIKRFGS